MVLLTTPAGTVRVRDVEKNLPKFATFDALVPVQFLSSILEQTACLP
jgi:hypothetical protein